MSGCINIAACCCTNGGGEQPTFVPFPLIVRADIFVKRRFSITPSNMDCGLYLVRVEPEQAFVRGDCLFLDPQPNCASRCIEASIQSPGLWYPTLNQLVVDFSFLGNNTFANSWLPDYTNECSADTLFSIEHYFVVQSTIPCLCFVSFVDCDQPYIFEYEYTNYTNMHICLAGQATLYNVGSPILEAYYNMSPLYIGQNAGVFTALNIRLTINNVTEAPIFNSSAEVYDWLTARDPADISVFFNMNFLGSEIGSGNCPFLDGSQANGCRFPNSLILNSLWNCYESIIKPDLQVIEEFLPEIISTSLTKDTGSWTYYHSLMNERVTEFSGCPTREQCDSGTPNDCTCYGDDIETGFVNPCGVNCPNSGSYSCFPPTSNTELYGTRRITIIFAREVDSSVCL